MRAKDLMIGDWVYDIILQGYTKVEVLTLSGIKGTIHDNVWHEKTFEPILLTPEILEKNGFIKDKGNEYSITYHILIPTGYEKNSYTIQITFYKVPLAGVNVLFKCWGWLPPDNCGMNDIHICNVEYVHNFQHALKLCGIEKEIQI